MKFFFIDLLACGVALLGDGNSIPFTVNFTENDESISVKKLSVQFANDREIDVESAFSSDEKNQIENVIYEQLKSQAADADASNMVENYLSELEA